MSEFKLKNEADAKQFHALLGELAKQPDAASAQKLIEKFKDPRKEDFQKSLKQYFDEYLELNPGLTGEAGVIWDADKDKNGITRYDRFQMTVNDYVKVFAPERKAQAAPQAQQQQAAAPQLSPNRDTYDAFMRKLDPNSEFGKWILKHLDELIFVPILFDLTSGKVDLLRNQKVPHAVSPFTFYKPGDGGDMAKITEAYNWPVSTDTVIESMTGNTVLGIRSVETFKKESLGKTEIIPRTNRDSGQETDGYLIRDDNLLVIEYADGTQIPFMVWPKWRAECAADQARSSIKLDFVVDNWMHEYELIKLAGRSIQQVCVDGDKLAFKFHSTDNPQWTIGRETEQIDKSIRLMEVAFELREDRTTPIPADIKKPEERQLIYAVRDIFAEMKDGPRKELYAAFKKLKSGWEDKHEFPSGENPWVGFLYALLGLIGFGVVVAISTEVLKSTQFYQSLRRRANRAESKAELDDTQTRANRAAARVADDAAVAKRQVETTEGREAVQAVANADLARQEAAVKAELADEKERGTESLLAQQAARDAIIEEWREKKKIERVKGQKVFEKYGRNLSAEVAGRAEDPALGRTNEVLAIRDVFNSPPGNPANAELIGDPGVGKTTIGESFAWHAQRDIIPEMAQYKGYEVWYIDMAKVAAAGSGISDIPAAIVGIFEGALQRNGGKVILFIDEFHMIIPLGTHSQSDQGAAELVKKFLERGEFKVIASTTREEHEKYIAKNPALKRRMREVNVAEQPFEQQIPIIQRNLKNVAEHKGLAVDLNDRALIDKLWDASSGPQYEGAQPNRVKMLILDVCDYLSAKSRGAGSAGAVTVAAIEEFLDKNRFKDLENKINELRSRIIRKKKAIEKQSGLRIVFDRLVLDDRNQSQITSEDQRATGVRIVEEESKILERLPTESYGEAIRRLIYIDGQIDHYAEPKNQVQDNQKLSANKDVLVIESQIPKGRAEASPVLPTSEQLPDPSIPPDHRRAIEKIAEITEREDPKNEKHVELRKRLLYAYMQVHNKRELSPDEVKRINESYTVGIILTPWQDVRSAYEHLQRQLQMELGLLPENDPRRQAVLWQLDVIQKVFDNKPVGEPPNLSVVDGADRLAQVNPEIKSAPKTLREYLLQLYFSPKERSPRFRQIEQMIKDMKTDAEVMEYLKNEVKNLPAQSLEAIERDIDLLIKHLRDKGKIRSQDPVVLEAARAACYLFCLDNPAIDLKQGLFDGLNQRAVAGFANMFHLLLNVEQGAGRPMSETFFKLLGEIYPREFLNSEGMLELSRVQSEAELNRELRNKAAAALGMNRLQLDAEFNRLNLTNAERSMYSISILHDSFNLQAQGLDPKPAAPGSYRKSHEHVLKRDARVLEVLTSIEASPQPAAPVTGAASAEAVEKLAANRFALNAKYNDALKDLMQAASIEKAIADFMREKLEQAYAAKHQTPVTDIHRAQLALGLLKDIPLTPEWIAALREFVKDVKAGTVGGDQNLLKAMQERIEARLDNRPSLGQEPDRSAMAQGPKPASEAVKYQESVEKVIAFGGEETISRQSQVFIRALLEYALQLHDPSLVLDNALRGEFTLAANDPSKILGPIWRGALEKLVAELEDPKTRVQTLRKVAQALHPQSGSHPALVSGSEMELAAELNKERVDQFVKGLKALLDPSLPRSRPPVRQQFTAAVASYVVGDRYLGDLERTVLAMLLEYGHKVHDSVSQGIGTKLQQALVEAISDPSKPLDPTWRGTLGALVSALENGNSREAVFKYLADQAKIRVEQSGEKPYEEAVVRATGIEPKLIEQLVEAIKGLLNRPTPPDRGPGGGNGNRPRNTEGVVGTQPEETNPRPEDENVRSLRPRSEKQQPVQDGSPVPVTDAQLALDMGVNHAPDGQRGLKVVAKEDGPAPRRDLRTRINSARAAADMHMAMLKARLELMEVERTIQSPANFLQEIDAKMEATGALRALPLEIKLFVAQLGTLSLQLSTDANPYKGLNPVSAETGFRQAEAVLFVALQPEQFLFDGPVRQHLVKMQETNRRYYAEAAAEHKEFRPLSEIIPTPKSPEIGLYNNTVALMKSHQMAGHAGMALWIVAESLVRALQEPNYGFLQFVGSLATHLYHSGVGLSAFMALDKGFSALMQPAWTIAAKWGRVVIQPDKLVRVGLFSATAAEQGLAAQALRQFGHSLRGGLLPAAIAVELYAIGQDQQLRYMAGSGNQALEAIASYEKKSRLLKAALVNGAAFSAGMSVGGVIASSVLTSASGGAVLGWPGVAAGAVIGLASGAFTAMVGGKIYDYLEDYERESQLIRPLEEDFETARTPSVFQIRETGSDNWIKEQKQKPEFGFFERYCAAREMIHPTKGPMLRHFWDEQGQTIDELMQFEADAALKKTWESVKHLNLYQALRRLGVQAVRLTLMELNIPNLIGILVAAMRAPKGDKEIVFKPTGGVQAAEVGYHLENIIQVFVAGASGAHLYQEVFLELIPERRALAYMAYLNEMKQAKADDAKPENGDLTFDGLQELLKKKPLPLNYRTLNSLLFNADGYDRTLLQELATYLDTKQERLEWRTKQGYEDTPYAYSGYSEFPDLSPRMQVVEWAERALKRLQVEAPVMEDLSDEYVGSLWPQVRAALVAKHPGMGNEAYLWPHYHPLLMAELSTQDYALVKQQVEEAARRDLQAQQNPEGKLRGVISVHTLARIREIEGLRKGALLKTDPETVRDFADRQQMEHAAPKENPLLVDMRKDKYFASAGTESEMVRLERWKDATVDKLAVELFFSRYVRDTGITVGKRVGATSSNASLIEWQIDPSANEILEDYFGGARYIAGLSQETVAELAGQAEERSKKINRAYLEGLKSRLPNVSHVSGYIDELLRPGHIEFVNRYVREGHNWRIRGVSNQQKYYKAEEALRASMSSTPGIWPAETRARIAVVLRLGRQNARVQLDDLYALSENIIQSSGILKELWLAKGIMRPETASERIRPLVKKYQIDWLIACLQMEISDSGKKQGRSPGMSYNSLWKRVQTGQLY